MIGKQVSVTKKNGMIASGKLVERNDEYVLLMRDCEYYLVYFDEIEDILVSV